LKLHFLIFIFFLKSLNILNGVIFYLPLIFILLFKKPKTKGSLLERIEKGKFLKLKFKNLLLINYFIFCGTLLYIGIKLIFKKTPIHLLSLLAISTLILFILNPKSKLFYYWQNKIFRITFLTGYLALLIQGFYFGTTWNIVFASWCEYGICFFMSLLTALITLVLILFVYLIISRSFRGAAVIAGVYLLFLPFTLSFSYLNYNLNKIIEMKIYHSNNQILQKAIASKNPSLCQKINPFKASVLNESGYLQKMRCYRKIADFTRKERQEKILEDKEKWYKKAIKTQDPKLCLKINQERDRSKCLLYIAKEKNNLSLCPKIKIFHYRSECYLYFAKRYNNRYFCKKVEDKNLYTKCLKETTNEILDSDFDGLPDEKEVEIGTDPFNSDTDGDGYFDGTEVENNYNPLSISL